MLATVHAQQALHPLSCRYLAAQPDLGPVGLKQGFGKYVGTIFYLSSCRLQETDFKTCVDFNRLARAAAQQVNGNHRPCMSAAAKCSKYVQPAHHSRLSRPDFVRFSLCKTEGDTRLCRRTHANFLQMGQIQDMK
jgi:hypothetical protein